MTHFSSNKLPEACRAFARSNTSLSDWTTFRIGGRAAVVLQVCDPADLQRVLAALRMAEVPRVLLGGGSNILAADDAIEAAVVVYRSDAPPRVQSHAGIWEVNAGVILDTAVDVSIGGGFCGLEELSGIPGTLGGAVVGNCGAFGREMSETVAWAEVLDVAGTVQRMKPEELVFSYRDSVLKGRDLTVLRVGLRLAEAKDDHPRQRRSEILHLRYSKHPDYTTLPTAGSYFKNIVDPKDGSRSAAGKLLDACGARGMSHGDAAVFEKHANILVNTGAARAADVLALQQKLQGLVLQRFGVTLQREVRYLGSDGVFDAC